MKQSKVAVIAMHTRAQEAIFSLMSRHPLESLVEGQAELVQAVQAPQYVCARQGLHTATLVQPQPHAQVSLVIVLLWQEGLANVWVCTSPSPFSSSLSA